MTEVKSYRCNRCGKTFTKDVDEKPSEVSLQDHDIAWDMEKPSTYDFCSDCVSMFYSFIEHDKDFDKFAESMQTKWEKEEEGK
jgi:hypothetical protein